MRQRPCPVKAGHVAGADVTWHKRKKKTIDSPRKIH